MKKLLLLSLAVAGAASMASADEYKSGGTQRFKEGYNLTIEWASLDCVGSAYRVGMGANNKFFLNETGTNNVHVYGPKGFEKTITMPNYCWVSSTADDAGHVLIRTSEVAWTGSNTAYPGAYKTDDGHKMYVIDSKTDEIIGHVDMKDGIASRGDVLGHIYGNVAEDNWELVLVADGNGQGMDWVCNALDPNTIFEQFPIKVQPPFAGSGAGKISTTGTAQIYGENADGEMLMAVYPNPALGISSSTKGFGNGIMNFVYSYDEEAETSMWHFTGEYIVTPQHASNNGYVIFEIGGKRYIVYTSGENGGTMAPDALAISELRYTDTPISDDEMDKSALVYRLFPATTDAGGFSYKTTSYFTSLNVERVADDPNSVYIYCYTQGAPMIKLKFTAPDGAGVEGVTVEEEGEAEFFNLQGIRVANPEHGVYIMRQGNKATKIIR